MHISVRTTGGFKQDDYEWRTPIAAGVVACSDHPLWAWTDGSGKHIIVVRRNANGDFSILLGSLISQQLDWQCRSIQIAVAIDGLPEEQARALACCYLTKKSRIEVLVREHVRFSAGNWNVKFSSLSSAFANLAEQTSVASSLTPTNIGKFTHAHSGETLGKIAQHISLHRFTRGEGIKLLVVDIPRHVAGWDGNSDIFSQAVERNHLWQEIGHEQEQWIPFIEEQWEAKRAPEPPLSSDAPDASADVFSDMPAAKDNATPWPVLVLAAGLGLLLATRLRK